MPRRKQDNAFDTMAELFAVGPAWLGPVLAAAVLAIGCLVLPAILDRPSEGVQTGRFLAPIIRRVTPFVAGAMLLVWLLTRVKRLADRRLFDGHAGKDSIRQLSWSQFESYVGEAFRRQGYSAEQTGDPAGDGGVDLILHKDAQTTLVQCKHWKAFKVGVQPVRELLGVISSEGAQAGVMVTSGRFTAEAWEFARGNRIRLIDGDALEKLVQSVRGAETSGSSDGTSRPDPAPCDGPTPSAPACPRCGQTMVIRTARRGTGAGDRFWGCQGYPRCKGTRPAG